MALNLSKTVASGLMLGALAACSGGTPPAETPAAQGDDPAAAPAAAGEPAGEAAEAKACCKGLNECAGKGSCKTAENACAGQNSCKGKGGCNGHCPG